MHVPKQFCALCRLRLECGGGVLGDTSNQVFEINYQFANMCLGLKLVCALAIPFSLNICDTTGAIC